MNLERIPYNDCFTIYGGHLSYFTQKVLVSVHWSGYPYNYISRDHKNGEDIAKRSQTQQIPILETQEGWMLADSSLILSYLDSQLPQPLFYPASMVGLVSSLLEEFFDEWISRLAVHFRWNYEDDTKYGSEWIAREFTGEMDPSVPGNQWKDTAEIIKKWGKRATKAFGISSDFPLQHIPAEQLLNEIYKELNNYFSQFSSSKTVTFIFGDRPSSVDTVIWGGLKAHFFRDPTPKKLYQQYEHLWRWFKQIDDDLQVQRPELVYGNFQQRDQKQYTKISELPQVVLNLLKIMSKNQSFIDFVSKNKEAIENKEKVFKATIEGSPVTFLTRNYVEKSRRIMNRRLSLLLSKMKSENNLHSRDIHFEFLRLIQEYSLGGLYYPESPLSSKL